MSIRGSLTRRECGGVAAMVGVIAALHIVGWFTLRAGVDLNVLGFAIVGLFVATWTVALLIWRYGRIEEKWARVD